MIYTTYFANLRKLPENFTPVSICAKAPSWYSGEQYKALAPKYGFFMEWKKTRDNEYYIRHFHSEVLAELNVAKVLNDLQQKIPKPIRANMTAPAYLDKEHHIALVCYEKPGDFCHRHIVSEWLRNHGIDCHEWYERS